jgi:hypothetical protein
LVATLPSSAHETLGNVVLELGNLAMSFCTFSALSVVGMSLVFHIAKGNPERRSKTTTTWPGRVKLGNLAMSF